MGTYSDIRRLLHCQAGVLISVGHFLFHLLCVVYLVSLDQRPNNKLDFPHIPRIWQSDGISFKHQPQQTCARCNRRSSFKQNNIEIIEARYSCHSTNFNS